MNVTETALYGTLTGGTALTNLLAAGTAGVYGYQAPQGSTYPLVEFGLASGEDVSTTPHREDSEIYLVKGVSTVSMQQAGAIEAQIDALLHRQTLTVTGYTNILTKRETQVRYVETADDGRQYWHAGAHYRVWLMI